MTDDIAYNRSFDLPPDEVEEVAPGVRRILCNNPGPFTFKGTDILFSGDHVMAWSTPVVAPPDGSMSDYMASLNKLAGRSETTYFPGHGGAVTDAPRFVHQYIRHREAREQSILRRLGKG